MAGPLFDPEKCNLESIPSLGFDFVSDCSIAEPPPPIFDCPLPIVPREPPPPLCPVFDTSAKFRYYRDGCSNQSSEPSVFTITKTDEDPCRYFLDLDLSIPLPKIPCPDIRGGSVTITTGYEECIGPPRGSIRVTTEERPQSCGLEEGSAQCFYTLDLDLNIPVPRPPCPVIEAGEVTITAGYEECVGPARGSIRVTTNENPAEGCSENGNPSEGLCQFTLDLDLNIPIPRPRCPIINAGEVTVTSGFEDCIGSARGSLRVTPNREFVDGCSENGTPSEGECEFTIDLDLNIPVPRPVCPVFEEGVVNVNTGYADCVGPATGALRVITKPIYPADCESDDAACEFRIELDIDVPIPRPVCPEIAITGVIGYTKVSAPIINTKAVPSETPGDCDDPGVCKFDIEVEIDLPPPVCPEIKATGVIQYTGISAPSMVVTVEPTPPETPVDPCKFDIDVSIDIPAPRPCPEITTTGVIGYTAVNAPTMAFIMIPTPPANAQDPCRFDFGLEIGLPLERPCPELTATGAIRYTSGRDEPSMVLTVTPTPPTSPTGPCKIDLNVDIDIPYPRSCPDITGVINVARATGPTGTITVTPTEPEDAQDPCKFKIDVDIGVPYFLLEVGSITADWTDCGDDKKPTCDVLIDPPNASGVQKLNIDIRIPKPPVYTGGKIDLGEYGLGTINITGECTEYAVEGAITLNTTTCPTGGGDGGGGGPSGPSGPAPSCDAEPCATSCPPGSWCNPIEI